MLLRVTIILEKKNEVILKLLKKITLTVKVFYTDARWSFLASKIFILYICQFLLCCKRQRQHQHENTLQLSYKSKSSTFQS